MQSSNKTGLVLKISVVLFILLATVVYKLNGYFKDEKWQSMQGQLRTRVVSVKTTVSSQLAQIKNTLSVYENELSEANINWVQLDPFFMIARAENSAVGVKVNQIVVRSNTPAERWNAAYLEKALSLNQDSKKKSIITTQLFQDKSGAKFLILRFKSAMASDKELIVAGAAEYFQKFFDIERGGVITSLLATVDGRLAAHTEGNYIAAQTKELSLSDAKYLIAKEEIIGTNLVMMSYVLRKKITSGFAVPMSIVGVVVGIGCVLVGIVFYTLDPIERRMERYKKQERDQIYKDTVGSFKSNPTAPLMKPSAPVKPPAPAPVPPKVLPALPEEYAKPAEEVKKMQLETEILKKAEPLAEEDTQKVSIEKILQQDQENAKISSQEFLSLEAEKNDLAAIEKALALDEFDRDENTAKISMDELEKNLTSQKISVSLAPVDKPEFVLEKKKFAVDDFKTHVRRPEKI